MEYYDLLKEVQDKFDFPIKLWKEGDISFFAPDLSIYEKKDYPPSRFPVFYNPMMIINRDLTILLIKSWIRKNKIQDINFGEPLCGIGIRGLRVFKEIGKINVFLNDFNEISIKLLQENLKFNNFQEKIKIYNLDANDFMNKFSKPRERFSILDIDPFGSPVQFVDSAIQALLGNQGLLCVSATDLVPLVGIYKEACFRKYGLYPIKTEYSHELALRILMTFLIREAAKHDIGLKILFNYYHQHHIRCFVETKKGKLNANASLKDLGFIYHCFNCNERYYTQSIEKILTNCKECDSELQSIGPIWVGKLFNKDLLIAMKEDLQDCKFNNLKKVNKLLDVMIEETDSPIVFHDLGRLMYEHKLKSKKIQDIIDALQKKGYICTKTHFSPVSIKTNAPRLQIAKIIKEL